MRLARTGVLPELFSSSVFEGGISLVFVIALTILFSLTVCHVLKAKGKGTVAKAFLVTFATVLLLFVVFKQFFNVNLAPGLLDY